MTNATPAGGQNESIEVGPDALDLDALEAHEHARIAGAGAPFGDRERAIVETDYQARTILALVDEVRRLRAEVEAVRAAIEDACAKLLEPGEYITPPELHHVEDHIIGLAVAAIRTTLRRTLGPVAETPEQP